MMDSSSVSQISVARSEAQSVAPSMAQSEGGRRSRRRPQTLKKSLSFSSMDSGENHEKVRRRGSRDKPTSTRHSSSSSSSTKRAFLKKSASMSSMSAANHHTRQLQKSRSRRHVQSNITPISSDRDAWRGSGEQRPSRTGSRATSRSLNKSGSVRHMKDDFQTSRRRRSRSANGRRKSDRSKITKRTTNKDAAIPSTTNGDGLPQKRSSKTDKMGSSMKAQSQHSNGKRRTSSRPSQEEAEQLRSTFHGSHRSRSASATRRKNSGSHSNSSKRTSNSRKSRHDPMSVSENVHRTRISPRNSAPAKSMAMHQSLSAVNVDLNGPNKPQKSRPPSRRGLAKRQSVRTSNWLRDDHQSVGALDVSSSNNGTHSRRRPSPRAVQEHDPLTMSPETANQQTTIYALGVLSDEHLENQPVANGTSSTISPAPQEIVKVRFVQSGGKVIPVKSSPKESPGGVSDTPRKTKNKLTNILTFGKVGRSKNNSKAPRSKYQTFSDGEGGFDVNDDATVESSWRDVDAAIPVLQL